mmetsp:Transcript_4861/g.11987  ORF Transcript_4861/g.11987 Transcript_4861/m.11987 type:complete len:236 (+) Transcript_4861:175-882(+)
MDETARRQLAEAREEKSRLGRRPRAEKVREPRTGSGGPRTRRLGSGPPLNHPRAAARLHGGTRGQEENRERSQEGSAEREVGGCRGRTARGRALAVQVAGARVRRYVGGGCCARACARSCTSCSSCTSCPEPEGHREEASADQRFGREEGQGRGIERGPVVQAPVQDGVGRGARALEDRGRAGLGGQQSYVVCRIGRACGGCSIGSCGKHQWQGSTRIATRARICRVQGCEQKSH